MLPSLKVIASKYHSYNIGRIDMIFSSKSTLELVWKFEHFKMKLNPKISKMTYFLITKSKNVRFRLLRRYDWLL